MAKITAVYDTVEKTLECDIDGKAVADLAEVYLGRGYNDDGKFSCSLMTSTYDEDEKTYHMTRLSASVKEDGAVELVAAEVTPAQKVAEDIQKYFGAE